MKKKVQDVDEVKVSTKPTPSKVIDDFIKKDDNVYRPSGEVNFRIPTGSIALDRMLGGGIPAGRITQIYGEPDVGKTTLAYHIYQRHRS
jgi:predicted ATP-dependent serine protease